EQQRDQSGDQEEEDDVTHGARDRPDQQQEQRQADELDPARDLDLRGRPGRHAVDDTARVVRLRPADLDWFAAEDGNLALDRHELWVEPEERPRLRLSQSPPYDYALQDEEGSVTVPPMPRDGGRSLNARQRRAQMQAVRRRRRVAGFVVLAIIALVVLLLSALGSGRPATAPQSLSPA